MFFSKILGLMVRFIDFFLSRVSLNQLVNLKRVILSFRAKVIFLVEGSNWVIYWVGKYITENLNKYKLISSTFDSKLANPLLPKKKLIHFGSINCFIRRNKVVNLKKSHKIIVSWFHINPNDKKLKIIPALNNKIDLLHTSNEITKQRLIELGFNENKIVLIPLGVDLLNFKRFDEKRRIQLKKEFNIPTNKIIIGSFQKDGVGWADGLEPKLIKGPDIFCKVVKKIQEDLDIHVFLTGPARGFIKNKLSQYKIPYTHIYLSNYLDLVNCYNVLDLYLITSRAEGGPKALLEGMASGVPIITTKVGMVPQIIKQGINGFIADIDDVDQLTQYAIKILKNKELKEILTDNGLNTVQDYSWGNIAKQYYFKLYKRLLSI